MNIWKMTTLALAILLAVVVGSATLRAEKQPHMRSALGSLQAARAELQAATADKGGHRVKAIAAVDLAITETKAGIEFDNARSAQPE